MREKEFSVLKRSIETEEMLKKTKFSPKRIKKDKVCIIFRVAEIWIFAADTLIQTMQSRKWCNFEMKTESRTLSLRKSHFSSERIEQGNRFTRIIFIVYEVLIILMLEELVDRNKSRLMHRTAALSSNNIWELCLRMQMKLKKAKWARKIQRPKTYAWKSKLNAGKSWHLPREWGFWR